MKINSNIQGMITQSILSSNEEKLSKSTQKMSSGYKINRAKDNPAGMAISNKMRAQLSSLDRANKNANNGRNVIQIADGALNEIESMLQRMNELSIKASNGTLTEDDRNAVQEEMTQLSSEITRISKSTEYNSKTLLDGSQDLKAYTDSNTVSVRSYNTLFATGAYTVNTDGNGGVTLLDKDGNSVDATSEITEYKDKAGNTTGYSTKLTLNDGSEITIDSKGTGASTGVKIDAGGYGGMKIQVGAEERQELQIVIPEVSLKSLGLEDLDGNLRIDCSTDKGAKEAIDMVSKAIDYVSRARSKIGAYQNRLEHTIANLDVTTENLTESYSTIKDIDMAEGMVEYTQLQVLVQAGTSMLAQANEEPQQALQLLQ